MHVGEETFYSIRLNALEMNAVAAEIDRLLEDNELGEDDVGMNYPALHRFFTCLGALRDDTTPIIPETPLVDDDTEPEMEMIDDADDTTTA